MQLWKWRSRKHQIVEPFRTAPRFSASDIPNLRIICDGGGPEAKLINISRRGALIESREYLSPGTSLYLQLGIDENIHYIRGRVIDHRDSSINSGVFKTAIVFDDDFTKLPSGNNLLEDQDF